MDSFDKKIILANNIKNARRIILKENLDNKKILNYEILTPSMLVEKYLILNKIDKRLISDKESSYILFNLIKKDNNKIYGFSDNIFTVKAIRKLLEIINDFRLSNINDFKYILNANYNKLLEDYKKELDSSNLIDYIFGLNEIKNIKIDAKLYYINDFNISKLEENIFKNIFNEIEEYIPKKRNNKINSSYKCYGIYSEIINALNIIEENKYSINDCEIIYTSDIYENFIRGILDSRKVKYSISNAHAKSTNLVSFMLDILNYVKEDYKYELLEEALKNKGINNIYLNEFYKTLNFPKVTVGFSRERTYELIDSIKNEENKINIINFLNDLLESVSLDDFNYSSFLNFSFKYIDAIGEKQALSAKLNNLKYLIDKSNNKIEDTIDELSQIRYTESDENSLQIGLLTKSFSLKKNLFIIGLSQLYISGENTENPFILDIDEYSNYLGNCKYLHILKNMKDEKIESVNYYIDYSVSNNIFISYPFYNKIDLRPSAPSALLINLNNGMPITKINTYDIKTNGIIINEFKIEDVNEIKDLYDNGKIGDLIDQKNHIDTINNTNNIKIVKENEYDFSMSPSAILKLLNCPFDYYYRYIKKLPDVNYPSLDVHKSLEANTKGTFFHKILEEYAKMAFKVDNFKDEFDSNIFDMAFSIARALAKSMSPALVDYIFLKESDEVKEYAEKYIKTVIKDLSNTGYRTLDTEYSIENENNYYLSSGKKIKFIGNIDRIDGYIKDDILHIRLIDYKTGNLKKKEEIDYVQHIIYSYSIINNKNLFNLNYKNIEIDSFSYVYPFSDNQSITYTYDEIKERTETLFNNLDKLIISFLKNDDYINIYNEYFDLNYEETKVNKFTKTICRYCQYTNLCFKKLKEGTEWVTKKN